MLNHIILMGRLTRDPDLRYTANGTAVAYFTLAVERDYRDTEGERQTDYIDCTAWRRTANFINRYFTKGSMAVVSGRLNIREWTESEGRKRRSAEVSVENIYFGAERKKTEEAEADTEGELPWEDE